MKDFKINSMFNMILHNVNSQKSECSSAFLVDRTEFVRNMFLLPVKADSQPVRYSALLSVRVLWCAMWPKADWKIARFAGQSPSRLG